MRLVAACVGGGGDVGDVMSSDGVGQDVGISMDVDPQA